MQIQEKHQVARSQLKDQFLLQKMLLIARHDKEMEQINRHNERLLKSLQERQRAEKIRLPKWQRSDGNFSLIHVPSLIKSNTFVLIMFYLGKTRESLFKSSIRIQNPNIDPKEEMEKMKDVCEN